MHSESGVLIGGRYQVERVLGEGGMGIVYLARQTDLDRRVAVKVLRRDAMTDQDVVTRFRREARVAARLTGPHVARILDFGTTEDGYPFMVLEHLEGNDLDDELERRGALPLDEAAQIILEACEGMKEAHAIGVVHRDLKPGNLFLARENGRRIVKVLDFGISKVTADEQVRVTQTSSAFGTPLYMSPEHVRSTKAVDHRTDIWSLGVILYELCTGVPPFDGESATAVAVAVATEPIVPPSVQRPGLPQELDEVVAKALAKNPADRYATIGDLADAIRQFATGEIASGPLPRRARTHTIEAAALSTTHVSPNTAARARRRLAIGAGVVLAGAGLIAVIATSFGPGSEASSSAQAEPNFRQETPTSAAAPGGQPVVAATSAPAPAEPVVSAVPAPSASAAPPRPLKPVSKPTATATATPAPKPTEKKDGSGRPIVL